MERKINAYILETLKQIDEGDKEGSDVVKLRSTDGAYTDDKNRV